LRLRPDTKNIFVVIGNSSLEQYWLAYLRREYQTFTNRVNFTWSNDLSLAEVLSKAARLPPQTSIFYFLLTVDARGEPHVKVKHSLHFMRSPTHQFLVSVTMNWVTGLSVVH